MKKSTSKKPAPRFADERLSQNAATYNQINKDNMPKIQGFIGAGVQVAADVDGNLYRINADMGTISKLRWE